jgi:hypothetical protein
MTHDRRIVGMARAKSVAQFIAVCRAYILAEKRRLSSRLQRPSRAKTWTSSRLSRAHGHTLRLMTNSEKLSDP